MVSVPDLGWGSVVGNALENGATYLPTGSDMAAACGMEVVLAERRAAPHGYGRDAGNRAWHVYKRSLGPSLDTLFMQSNFGIVTKMGVWLMPMPECYMPLWLRVWRDDDLPALVETLRTLMLERTIENVPQIWNTIADRVGAVRPARRGTRVTSRSPTRASTRSRASSRSAAG